MHADGSTRLVQCANCGYKAKAPNARYPLVCSCRWVTYKDGSSKYISQRTRGLGDYVAIALVWLGFKKCKPCERRRQKLNRWSQRAWLRMQRWLLWWHPR